MFHNDKHPNILHGPNIQANTFVGMPSGWMKGVDIITNLSSMGNRPRPMHVMPIPGKIDMESKPRTMVVVVLFMFA